MRPLARPELSGQTSGQTWLTVLDLLLDPRIRLGRRDKRAFYLHVERPHLANPMEDGRRSPSLRLLESRCGLYVVPSRYAPSRAMDSSKGQELESEIVEVLACAQKEGCS